MLFPQGERLSSLPVMVRYLPHFEEANQTQPVRILHKTVRATARKEGYLA